MKFKVGQRWVSQTEPQLGLGRVCHIDGRRITIHFAAAEEDRTYAAGTAPVSRVTFAAGDRVELADGSQVLLNGAMLQNDLMFYAGQDAAGNERVFAELELSSAITLHAPEQRLASGLIDRLSTFRLRVRALSHRARLQAAPVRGLLGSRTSLLPHQVYIAHEVARRFAPRVLLADEVGLGKTIEAGMILHHQILCGLASRVLVVVPEPLVNQWLVEMLRRFNLVFTIIDRARLEALRDAGESQPFVSAQLILCSLDLFSDSPEHTALAAASGWDLLVVDEAHHLRWSPTEPSAAYRAIETLAQHSRGVLLLTATPEQLGVESHFARLRLLDPARFHDLAAFRASEAAYQELVPLALALRSCQGAPDADLRGRLARWLDAESLATLPPADLLARLLDCYGTGRVFFRNTRATVEGFPARHLHPRPLTCPPLYQAAGQPCPLWPEEGHDPTTWLREDPRVAWLEAHLLELRPRKVLVICARAATAIALEGHLALRRGIRAVAFHEGLSLLERDRAAAYFADGEQGAQTLICSEIGSEGRNFQFAHHLVLFDLPWQPDLLEQRIGRLDRIGQLYPVEIHVPYLKDTVQEHLFRWFDAGLDAFNRCFSAAAAITERLGADLPRRLASGATEVAQLVEETRVYADQLRATAASGREPLLELNSCRPEVANRLIEEIQEAETSSVLKDFMEDLCDEYGVHHEEHSLHALIMKPTDQMLTGHFPGLRDEHGITATFSREHALRREDLVFLSWEHPLVDEAIDMLLSGEVGNATLASLRHNGLRSGTLLLEAYFAVALVAPRHLQLGQYLPAQPIRILTDLQGRTLEALISSEQLDEFCLPVKKVAVPQILEHIGKDISRLVASARRLATDRLPPLRDGALAAMRSRIGAERDRLRALQAVNPTVRDEELAWFEKLLEDSAALLGRANLEIQAMRLLIVLD